MTEVPDFDFDKQLDAFETAASTVVYDICSGDEESQVRWNRRAYELKQSIKDYVHNLEEKVNTPKSSSGWRCPSCGHPCGKFGCGSD